MKLMTTSLGILFLLFSPGLLLDIPTDKQLSEIEKSLSKQLKHMSGKYVVDENDNDDEDGEDFGDVYTDEDYEDDGDGGDKKKSTEKKAKTTAKPTSASKENKSAAKSKEKAKEKEKKTKAAAGISPLRNKPQPKPPEPGLKETKEKLELCSSELKALQQRLVNMRAEWEKKIVAAQNAAENDDTDDDDDDDFPKTKAKTSKVITKEVISDDGDGIFEGQPKTVSTKTVTKEIVQDDDDADDDSLEEQPETISSKIVTKEVVEDTDEDEEQPKAKAKSTKTVTKHTVHNSDKKDSLAKNAPSSQITVIEEEEEEDEEEEAVPTTTSSTIQKTKIIHHKVKTQSKPSLPKPDPKFQAMLPKSLQKTKNDGGLSLLSPENMQDPRIALLAKMIGEGSRSSADIKKLLALSPSSKVYNRGELEKELQTDIDFINRSGRFRGKR